MLIGSIVECSFRKGHSAPWQSKITVGHDVSVMPSAGSDKKLPKLHHSSSLQKQDHCLQHPSKFSSTQQWSAGGFSISTNLLNRRLLPPSSLKTELIVRIKIIDGNSWLGVPCKVQSNLPEIILSRTAWTQIQQSAQKFVDAQITWIWTMTYSVTMLNYYWEWLIHDSFSYFLKSKDKSFLLLHHHHIFLKFLFL